jgi:AraC-like DNA-binding protein
MSHINYSFNQTDDSLPRDKMKLRNIASTRYSGDWPSIPHSHSYAELFYIVDGAGQFQINDKLFPVQAHQLVVVNPNVIHTEVSLESHPLEYIVLGIEGLEFTISDAAEGSFCVYTFDGNNDVLPCMRKILTEMQNRESNFQILCQAYMDIIVVQLMRNASVSAVPIHSRLPANRQCATVKRYIDHHYKENLTLDELAEKVSISKYHMAHAFKREYGVSPINYIIDCRIREGKRLLAETDLAPSQIASILGFSSSSYFCKSFSNIEGTSPTEYRKANQVKF